MKKTLLITCLLATSISNAQMTSANEPAIGSTADLFILDSFVTNYAGVTGTGVTWDYSTTTGYNGAFETVDVLDASVQPFASNFAGATKVISIGGNINTYFSSTANDRSSQGFHMDEATLGDVLVQYNTNDLLMATYPFDFGTTAIDDPYAGEIDLTFNGFPVNELLTGSTNALIDGTGTLIYPFGSTATNVIRYYSADTASTTLPILGAVDIFKIQYEYYDYATQNLPVFMHIKIVIVQSGSTVPISETNLVLSKVEGGNVSVSELSEINFTLAPNPADDVVKVMGAFTSEATANLLDQSGRVLSSSSIQNGQSIDLNGLASGMYMIAITDNGVTTTKTIMKK